MMNTVCPYDGADLQPLNSSATLGPLQCPKCNRLFALKLVELEVTKADKDAFGRTREYAPRRQAH